MTNLASKKRKPSYAPSDYTYRDVIALKALSKGEATPDQQKQALDWVIKQAAGLYEEHFYDESRQTDYALGKASVGRQVVKLVNYPPELMDRLRQQESPSTKEN